MPAKSVLECAEELLYALEAQARAQRAWEVAETNYSDPRPEHRNYNDAMVRVGSAMDDLRAALSDAPDDRVLVPREATDEWAERFCAAVNWHPDGTENKVIEGKLHSVTFRDLAKGYIRAMLAASEPKP